MQQLGRRVMAGVAAVGLLGAGAITAPAGRAAPLARPLDGQAFLQQLTSPSTGAPLPADGRIVQHSSHDRSGANGDGGTYDPVYEQKGTPQYIRRDGDRYVLFDEQRPGCLSRMWFTGVDPALGGLGDFGTLEFRFDGEATPRLAATATDLFSGTLPDFPTPLVGHPGVSSGGNYSYVPLCFARSLEVTAVRPKPGLGFYQLTAFVLPHGTPVTTWTSGSLDVRTAAHRLEAPGAAPARTAEHVAEADLAPGSSLGVAAAGAGAIEHLRFDVAPFDIETLRSLRLRISADGEPAQVDVPLAAALGDGLEVRPIHAIAFGMDPAAGSGYLALPAPFARSIEVTVTAARAAHVRVEAWRRRGTPDDERLHGRQRLERATIGNDYTALDEPGAGRLAAWVLDIAGQQGSGTTKQPTFLEGDMRVHVDGSRSPTVYGTGTEDEFNAGFYYTNGPFSLPTHGAGPLGVAGDQATQSQYRVFVADPITWGSSVRMTMEHGASNEDAVDVASTTFTYRRASTRQVIDRVAIGDPSSEAAHHLTGSIVRQRMTAYFEGDHDGNVTVPVAPLGLLAPASPAEVSSEAVTLDGVVFDGPLSVDVTARRGCDLVLRRVRDAARPGALDVAVGDADRIPWRVAPTNSYKRWSEDDLVIPGSAIKTNGVTIVLNPVAGPETLFDLVVLRGTCR